MPAGERIGEALGVSLIQGRFKHRELGERHDTAAEVVPADGQIAAEDRGRKDVLLGQRGECRGNERLTGHTKIGLLAHVRIMPPASDNRTAPVECCCLPVSPGRAQAATPPPVRAD